MLGLPYTIQEIAELGEGTDLFQGRWPAIPLHYLAFDSRIIAKGETTIFVALETSHRDGHDYVEDAYRKGVRHFILERPVELPEISYVLTEDSLAFVQRWAHRHRLRFDFPVVGITGSNGKTTVKEWATTLLEQDYRIVKSPMSYNSQLGVALSLLHISPQADLALIEAGISQRGEMETLAAMIQPTLGVLTHMGSAHAEGFDSLEEKVKEKLQLFATTEKVLATTFQPKNQAWGPEVPWTLIGTGPQADRQILAQEESPAGWQVLVQSEGKEIQLSIPLPGAANLENALLALHLARELGVDWETLPQRLALLRPVAMRTEIISDNPDLTIINDAYNSDLDSIRNAFQLLMETKAHSKRRIVLSDLLHQGDLQMSLQAQVYEEATALVGADQVFLVGPMYAKMGYPNAFPDVQALMEASPYETWTRSTVLLKGARNFALENMIPWLQRNPNVAYFHIDLDRLIHNYRFFRHRLPAACKVMAMVKAASYGGGTWEIAQILEREGVEYLAVAYVSEGISLREAGISLPIMVMNPNPDSVEELIRFELEPEISQFEVLDRYLRAARLADLPDIRIHLKLETGMGRLGFQEEQLSELVQRLLPYPDLRIISVMSHLAAADDPAHDQYSKEQAHRFLQMYHRLEQELGLMALRHLLNTAGVLHYPEYHLDMVRLGIGLYGIDPTADQAAGGQLREIGSLRASISQVAVYPVGASIGYGRSQILTKESRIATIPVGYADGIPRALSNGKISFLVRGQWAPTVGKICMDMLMLDVTEIPEAKAGDEVVLIGQQGEASISVQDLARAADTIPYEILVGISPRVRRVFGRE